VARPLSDVNGIGSTIECIRGQRVRTAMRRSWLERVRERALRRGRQLDRIAGAGRSEELDDVSAVATAPWQKKGQPPCHQHALALGSASGFAHATSTVAAERPASPGPHRADGEYHGDGCAGSGACVSWVRFPSHPSGSSGRFQTKGCSTRGPPARGVGWRAQRLSTSAIARHGVGIGFRDAPLVPALTPSPDLTTPAIPR